MKGRIWGIFFFISLVLIFALAAYQLYGRVKAAESVSMQKGAELNNKLLEVAQIKADLTKLNKEKDDLEVQMKSQINDLQSATNNYVTTINGQSEKLGDLAQENNTLKSDLESKVAMVSNLSNEVSKSKKDRFELSDKIKTLEEELEKAKSQIQPPRPRVEPQVVSCTETPKATKKASDSTTILTSNMLNSEALGNALLNKATGLPVIVQEVNEKFGFIVISGGRSDGLAYNAPVNIVRGGQLISKAVVQRIKSDICVALILPEFTKDKIMVGDTIYQP